MGKLSQETIDRARRAKEREIARGGAELDSGLAPYIQEARQLAAATLLARQRQGAGQEGAYGGAMGTAIANALARQQQYREDIGQPKGTFLDWYVSQLNGAAA